LWTVIFAFATTAPVLSYAVPPMAPSIVDWARTSVLKLIMSSATRPTLAIELQKRDFMLSLL
jgi:hypothetical protein